MIYAFYQIYVKRIVLIALGLTVILFITIMFSFFTLSKTFNEWSVSVDLCQETVEYQKNFGAQITQQRASLESVLTCLSAEGKQAVKNQLVSVMLAQSSILNIMKHLARTPASEHFLFEKAFENKFEFLEHVDEIRA